MKGFIFLKLDLGHFLLLLLLQMWTMLPSLKNRLLGIKRPLSLTVFKRNLACAFLLKCSNTFTDS